MILNWNTESKIMNADLDGFNISSLVGIVDSFSRR